MKFLPRPQLLPRMRDCSAACAWAALLAVPLLATGCASPGHPSAPSLQVPRQATDLYASRSGDQVHLHWTTPGRTTDGIALTPPISAEICRSSTPPALTSPRTATACAVVQNLSVRPGPSDATDTLPPALATGAPAILIYQVQLKGSLGKNAGPSSPAYTASGTAPPPIASLRATDTKAGALLEWTPQPAVSQTVELSRTIVSSPAAPAGASAPTRVPNPFRAKTQTSSPPSSVTGPAVTRLAAGSADSGGVLDRTAELGASYEYTAQRILTLIFATRTVELRSAPSAPVALTLRDVFPPNPPAGLVATPGPGSIDLSWEPGTEPRIAGYRVYRAEASRAAAAGEAWSLLTPDLLNAPAYRDLTASPGHPYRYRVTALDTIGNESSPSNTASETGPQP
jgi:hypothetical protein